jgi:hypothetical protein
VNLFQINAQEVARYLLSSVLVTYRQWLPYQSLDLPDILGDKLKDYFKIFHGSFTQYADTILMGQRVPGRVVDYSPPTIEEVKNTWIHTSTPSIYLLGF